MKKVIFRLSIILFWVVLIFIPLYLPMLSFFESQNKTLTIFAWGDILDPAIVEQFEKETNIHVRLNYYSSNEELVVKLKATKGKGYDLIIPSDYVVPILQSEGLLKEIDKTKLNFFSELSPLLLNHSYDPGNLFSIPFSWDVFALGVDEAFFQKAGLEASWKLIFAPPKLPYRVTMINDPLQSTLLGILYLFGSADHLSESEVKELKNLMIQQKQWLEAYTNFGADYFLATRSCPVVVALSSTIVRAMRKFPFIDIKLPIEGTYVSIEGFAIPSCTEKEDLVYQFLNYIYEQPSLKAHYETFGFFPASSKILEEVKKEEPGMNKLVTALEQDFSKLMFTKHILPQLEVHDLWVEIKSSEDL